MRTDTDPRNCIVAEASWSQMQSSLCEKTDRFLMPRRRGKKKKNLFSFQQYIYLLYSVLHHTRLNAGMTAITNDSVLHCTAHMQLSALFPMGTITWILWGNPAVFHYYTTPLAPFSNFCMPKPFFTTSQLSDLHSMFCCWFITHPTSLCIRSSCPPGNWTTKSFLQEHYSSYCYYLFMLFVCITLPMKPCPLNKKWFSPHKNRKCKAATLIKWKVKQLFPTQCQ